MKIVGQGTSALVPDEVADQADRAAEAHGPQRLLERAGAADLDDVVDPGRRRSAPWPASPQSGISR